MGYGIIKDLEIGFNVHATIYHHSNPDLAVLYFSENGFLELALTLISILSLTEIHPETGALQ